MGEDGPVRPQTILIFEDCAFDPRSFLGTQAHSLGSEHEGCSIILNTTNGATYLPTVTRQSVVVDTVNDWHAHIAAYVDWEQRQREAAWAHMNSTVPTAPTPGYGQPTPLASSATPAEVGGTD